MKTESRRVSPVPAAMLLLSACFLLGCRGGTEGAASTSLDPPAEPDPPGDVPAFPFIAHVDQADITSRKIRFTELFVLGDELFETEFTTLDGVGIRRLPDCGPMAPGCCDFPARFSRIPPGCGRFSGPNGQACVGCHNTPFPTSAGEIAGNVLQDPAGAGAPPFNTRSVISLFGSGVPQRIAEEITEDLQRIRDEAIAAAIASGAAEVRALVAKGISYGSITATPDGSGGATVDLSGVSGVDPDLVVRPFGWKGNRTTLRDFVRSAAFTELGMEADELAAKDPLARPDPDGDGVEGELSVGDVTAITIYIAAQPVPVSRGRLVADGFAPPLPAATAQAIARGRTVFDQIGCGRCHVPEIRISDPVFEEPTLRGGGSYLDTDIDPAGTALDPARPFRFDLTREGDLPRLEVHPQGGAVARVFGDFRRHFMGDHLADAQPTAVEDARGRPLVVQGNPVSVPEGVFFTPELWGVGNTGPWLHDGRAGSLEEAILLHGVDSPPPNPSEAQVERDLFKSLSDSDRRAVVEFLKSLILVSFEEED